MGRFGNFDSPEDPVAIVREGFATDSPYTVTQVTTFELATLLRHKGN